MNTAEKVIDYIVRKHAERKFVNLPQWSGSYSARYTGGENSNTIVIYDYSTPIAIADLARKVSVVLGATSAMGYFISQTTSKHVTQLTRAFEDKFGSGAVCVPMREVVGMPPEEALTKKGLATLMEQYHGR